MSTTFTTRAPVSGRRGAIATSSYLATEAGLNMLRQGGNAVDAILAAAAVLNVVEPMCSHLGGDGFMLYWDATTHTVTAINGSGPAPMGLTPEHFRDSIPASGFLSSTIPGMVGLWDDALSRFGTRKPAEVLHEALYYATEGAPVSRDLANNLAGSREKLAPFPSSMAVFMPDGGPPERGTVLRQPDLARTLQAMADQGFRAFYEGETAHQIADFWQAHGGAIAYDDLAGYHARVLAPVETTYRGHTVYEQPPASQGHILLQSLNLVETFDLAAWGHLSPEALHVCLEANKLSHADKDRYTTDPAWVPFPAGLLSKDYAADRARLIRLDQALEFPPPAGQPPSSQDTTYLCCVDGQGNAVSYIQSVFHGFGCGVVAQGTGVMLNNRGCGFSLDPEHVNFLQPGKKTVHTLNTYMVLRDGWPVIVGGTPGGDIQVQTNLQVITNLVDFGRDAQQAVEDPRWWRGEKRSVGLEERAPQPTFAGLRQRGHEVEALAPYGQGGRAQVILVNEDGTLTAGSDPRCDGCALAF
jgi:gamma-glutamyltranspeptidase / glutathione hydrolase